MRKKAPYNKMGSQGRSHSFTSCQLFSDPGGEWQAPFAGEASSQNRAFLPMCVELPPWSLGCPPPGLQTGSGPGCAPGASGGACWGPSPGMRGFFGVAPGAPAIWVDGGYSNPQFTATR